jgi:hypothetical protein
MRAPLLATTVELALASLFYRYLFTQRMAGNLQKPNLLSGGAVARPMPPSCALTNKRSAYGVRKEGGECLMTRRSFGEPGAEGCGCLGVMWTNTENIPTYVTAGEATRK